jgi:hypothetical protein
MAIRTQVTISMCDSKTSYSLEYAIFVCNMVIDLLQYIEQNKKYRKRKDV